MLILYFLAGGKSITICQGGVLRFFVIIEKRAGCGGRPDGSEAILLGAITSRCPACGTLNRAPADRMGKTGRCGMCRAEISFPVRPVTPVELTDANFDREVRAAGYPALVEFWSPSCGHCIGMAPVLDELARELAGRVKVAKLDVTANPKTASVFGVTGTPTFVLFRGGREAARFVGAMPRAELTRRLAGAGLL